MPPRFEDVYSGKPGLLYQVHQDSVLACDPTKFLEMFDIERIARAGKLRPLRGLVYIAINGWDDDPRALHEIPEVRAFVQCLDQRFPYLAYVGTTKTEALKVMSLCLVPSSVTLRSNNNEEQFAASFDTQGYHRILERWFTNFDRACAMTRAITRQEHSEMKIELAQYFGVEWYFK